MAKLITDLDDAIEYINSLYNNSSTPPSSTEEDYMVWQSMINVAVNLWENEEGMLWNELFLKLSDAPDGDATTDGTNSYDCPSLFRFHASSVVWLGSGTNKTAYKVIRQEEKQLYENDRSNWCYFLFDASPTLEFNPNITIPSGQTITYNYYKYATKLTTGASTFEMNDPMFAVYYVVSELKKEEGNANELSIVTQKLNAMKTRNDMPSWVQSDDFLTASSEAGFNT